MAVVRGALAGLVLTATIASCGQPEETEALRIVTRVCDRIVQLSHSEDPDTTRLLSKEAAQAGKAARLDRDWGALARAVSDYEIVTADLVDLTERRKTRVATNGFDSDEFSPAEAAEFKEILPRYRVAFTDLKAEYRKTTP